MGSRSPVPTQQRGDAPAHPPVQAAGRTGRVHGASAKHLVTRGKASKPGQFLRPSGDSGRGGVPPPGRPTYFGSVSRTEKLYPTDTGLPW